MNKVALLVAALALSTPGSAWATGFTDIGEDIRAHPDTTVAVNGSFRVRGELDYNLDLDRGPTPSGQVLFPVPLSDPTGQTLTGADMRLRTDVSFYAPFASVAVKVRVDAPDNLALGSMPEGVPLATTTQQPITLMRMKRAYGEVLTPIGLFAAGRMGSQWGLGILTNGGDCADCDSGDAADRVAFLTPVAGHIWAIAYDFSATGPLVPRRSPNRVVDVDPTADVRSVTFAVLRFHDDVARERRRLAGKTTFEYGAYGSYRWQNEDVPTAYLPVAAPVSLSGAQAMSRGYTAAAGDLWLRLTGPSFRVEGEGAVLAGTIQQPSLIPGVLERDPIKSTQIGAAIESEIGAPEDRFGGGLDLGYASGDPAPGFGVRASYTSKPPQPGDLDGPQFNPPGDTRVDNFRFHPDYRIDRILFREIIGTVTDAVYFRPHVRARVVDVGPSALSASVAAIASFATYASSTPGQKSPLGLEIDPTLSWGSTDGFSAALEYAVLFPFVGLDNPELHLAARPAQLIRMRVMYAF